MAGELVLVAVGSNLGVRAAYLASARQALDDLPNTRVIAASSVEETAPIGPAAQHPFLNQMIALETELSPRDLLVHLHRIELENGRVRTVRWGPRTLDLDIVRFGERSIHESDLVIPHPAIPQREFWQREIAELDRALENR